jgi:hypothetical protein
MARPSARRKKSRGDTKAGAPRSFGVKEERHGRITTVTGRLNIQGTPTCRIVTVRDLRRLGVIGERGRDLLRRLKERPGFPKLKYDE